MEYMAGKDYKIPDKVQIPYSGVKLTGGRLKKLWDNNISFLKRFDTDRMLYWYRVRAGKPAPGVPYGNLDGHFESNLHGQTAGEFLMGAATALLWQEDEKLRHMVNAVVDGIEQCADEDGYLMAIPKESFSMNEYPNYVRAWVTFGLLAAGAAGNEKAYGMARRMGDWFNKCDCLPYVKDLNLGFQGILANTELYRSPVGTEQDLQIAQTYYREDWWLEQLIRREQRAIYKHPGDHPHSTLLTTLEAILDMYRVTGEKKLLQAVQGALEMYKDKWQHVGGGIVMCEADRHYPGCNFLKRTHQYNEICSTTFWILLHQRLHLLEPENAENFDQIEESLYNVLTASQVEDRGIHYLALLDGSKDYRWQDVATCCTGTGARLISMVPQMLYSRTEKEIYVNLYADSEARLGDTTIRVKTEMPYDGQICIELPEVGQKVDLRLRIPRWCASEVTVCGQTAKPGTYLTVPDCGAGTVIKFTLPFGWKSTRYTGAEEVPGKEMWAFEYGPLLLAAGGRNNVTVRLEPEHPEAWLERFSKTRFRLKGSNCQEYLVYMDIEDEPLTVYPFVIRPENTK